MKNKPFSDILPESSDFAIECMHFHKDVSMSSAHFHSHYEIFYVQSGKRNFKINNSKMYELSSSNIALLRPNIIHQGFSASDTGQKRTLINISQHLISELSEFFSPAIVHCFNVPVLQLTHYEAGMLNYLFQELLENHPNMPLYNEKIKINLSKILLLLCDIYYRTGYEDNAMLNQTTQSRVDYAIEYIQQNYSSPTVLSDISDKLHISEIYLERIFKRTMNTNLHKYLSTIRIMNAKRLLESNAMSVSKVASSCGFNNHVSFSRAFKRIEGYSPKEYQLSCKKS